MKLPFLFFYSFVNLKAWALDASSFIMRLQCYMLLRLIDLFVQCTDYKKAVLKLAVLPASCDLYVFTY